MEHLTAAAVVAVKVEVPFSSATRALGRKEASAAVEVEAQAGRTLASAAALVTVISAVAKGQASDKAEAVVAVATQAEAHVKAQKLTKKKTTAIHTRIIQHFHSFFLTFFSFRRCCFTPTVLIHCSILAINFNNIYYFLNEGVDKAT